MQTEPSTVFAAWAAHNGRTYAPEEFEVRLEVYRANVARQLERVGLTEGAVEVNGLADISREEFKATHLGHVSRSAITELGWAPASRIRESSLQVTGCNEIASFATGTSQSSIIYVKAVVTSGIQGSCGLQSSYTKG